MKDLYNALIDCETEEEVKSEYAKFFKFSIKTRDRIDHYTPEILYEFKYDVNLKNVNIRAKCVAQTLYYIREIKYGSTTRTIPFSIAIVDKNEAFFVETAKFSNIYSNDKKYDWDRQPSNPDKKLVADVAKTKEIKSVHVYDFTQSAEVQNYINKHISLSSAQISMFENDKKQINEDNFLEIFVHWDSLFGKYVKNGHKSSEYFLSDIEKDRAIHSSGNTVFFTLTDGTAVIKTVPIKDYEYFWNTYEKVSDPLIVHGIRQKMDRLTEDYQRRFTGEFFTPISFAEKALKYIERVVGSDWWEKGNYRLWDMAAGTGNLEFNLPSSALQYCYISTLIEDDANYCKKIFPSATSFQYDYLNDDVDLLRIPLLKDVKSAYKMPQNLIDDLANPNLKWIILINPPFATSNKTGNITGKSSKDNVSMTKIREWMTEEDLGETSRELFSQFLFRIAKEFEGKEAHLGLFSKIKYINSNNDQKLRDKVFNYTFKEGFVFSSKNFAGTRGNFPVGFLVWDLAKEKALEQQSIVVDVFDEDAYKYARKRIASTERDQLLNKWFVRERNTHIFPPFSSATKIPDGNKDVRDRIADGFICALMCNGSDLQHQNQTALFSGPSASAGGTSLTENNFEKGMIVHAVRRIVIADWTNDRDHFLQPYKDVPEEFSCDCVIWSAFSNSNQTTSLKDVHYKGNTYQIRNNLFPFRLNEIRQWKCSLDDLSLQIISENEDRFLAKWIDNHTLSNEAKDVVSSAKKLYKYFYEIVGETNWLEYKIGLWDVGFYQVRRTIADYGGAEEITSKFIDDYHKLTIKLAQQVSKYGFVLEPLVPL